MNAEFNSVPFVAGSIRGERCWRIEDGKLFSPQQYFVWDRGENLSKCEVGVTANIKEALTKYFLKRDQHLTRLQYRHNNTTYTYDPPDLQSLTYHASTDNYADISWLDSPVIVHWQRMKIDVNFYEIDWTGNKSFSSPEIEIGTLEISWREFNRKIVENYSQTHTHASCTCGFYAYLNGVNGYQSNCHVMGIIEGYGETTIGTRGFRAQKAKILALAPTVPLATANLRRLQDDLYLKTHGYSRGGVVAYNGRTTNRKDWQELRRNYPDAAFFDTIEKMKKKFPATDVSEIL